MKKMSALEAYPSDDLMGEKEQYSYPEVSNIVLCMQVLFLHKPKKI